MPKWEYNREYEYMDLFGKGRVYRMATNYMGKLAAAHNADIDRLESDRDSETRWACQYKAERDALAAKLEALKPKPPKSPMDQNDAKPFPKSLLSEIGMSILADYGDHQEIIATDLYGDEKDAICGVYNDLRVAYDAMTAERDEWKDKERVTSELFEAACNDLGAAQERIAALEAKLERSPFEREPVRVTTYIQDIHSESVCTVSKADYDKLKGENDQLWRDVERLRAQLAACAAGPWRTDVENAPRDGSEIAGEFGVLGSKERHFVVWHPGSGSWRSPSEKLSNDALLAFAIPNPPQKTGD